jgi:hypothetical protein
LQFLSTTPPNAQVSSTFFEASVSVPRIPREIKRNKWRRQFVQNYYYYYYYYY